MLPGKAHRLVRQQEAEDEGQQEGDKDPGVSLPLAEVVAGHRARLAGEGAHRADQLGRALDPGWPASADLEEETKTAATLLAQKQLAVKFVQGLPVVGVVGGAVNFSAAGRVSQWGALKYKKRFLERKVRGL